MAPDTGIDMQGIMQEPPNFFSTYFPAVELRCKYKSFSVLVPSEMVAMQITNGTLQTIFLSFDGYNNHFVVPSLECLYVENLMGSLADRIWVKQQRMRKGQKRKKEKVGAYVQVKYICLNIYARNSRI